MPYPPVPGNGWISLRTSAFTASSDWADAIASFHASSIGASLDVTSNQVVELITTGRYGDMGLSAQDAAQVEEDQ